MKFVIMDVIMEFIREKNLVQLLVRVLILLLHNVEMVKFRTGKIVQLVRLNFELPVKGRVEMEFWRQMKCVIMEIKMVVMGNVRLSVKLK